MPFVRYARDRRGYETLYVMHAFDGGSPGNTGTSRNARVRVLYACRTVPYAKVGRMTIDESVQRRIETAYPSLTFEWTRLLKEAAQSAPRPERTDPRQEQRKARGKKKREPQEPQQVRQVRQVREVREVRPPVAEVPTPEGVETAELLDPDQAIEAADILPLEPVTELVEWNGAETVEPIEPEVLEIPRLEIDRAWPIVDVAGPDRALVLRARYIELASKILSRVDDPSARRRLFREAGRLNPEDWTTADEARKGLETFETVYATLAEQLRR